MNEEEEICDLCKMPREDNGSLFCNDCLDFMEGYDDFLEKADRGYEERRDKEAEETDLET